MAWEATSRYRFRAALAVTFAALGQTILTFLFGVKPIDPVTFGSVALVLLLTAAVATAAPALRAARADPTVAFRNE